MATTTVKDFDKLLGDIGRVEAEVTKAIETETGAALQKFTGFVLQRVEELYDERIRSTTGATARSVRPQITESGDNFQVDFYADEHLEYIDKGVTGRGWAGYNGNTTYRQVYEGEFQFRNLNVSRDMVDNIEQFWIAASGMSIPNGMDPRSFAFAIAKNIKRRGIKPTGIFTDAVDAGVLSDMLREQLGESITVSISKSISK